LSVDEIIDAPGLTRKSTDYFAGTIALPLSHPWKLTKVKIGKYGAPPHNKRLSPLLYPFHGHLAKKAFSRFVDGTQGVMKDCCMSRCCKKMG
jgi:hypothetical protein